jgi:heat shock protein HtpX
MTLMIILFGMLLGGNQGLKIASALALGFNFLTWWFSADLVLTQTRARILKPGEAPELVALVSYLAKRANLPQPRVAIVNDPTPNAFATGRNSIQAVVAVTTGLLSLMNQEELAGVLGHELTHIKNRDILIGSMAAVMAGTIMLLANLAKFNFIYLSHRPHNDKHNNPIAALLIAFLTPLAALLIQTAISRSREYLADDGGASIVGTPTGLASALNKLGHYQDHPQTVSPATAHIFIVNPLNRRSLSNLFATHPPLKERIARLNSQILCP